MNRQAGDEQGAGQPARRRLGSRSFAMTTAMLGLLLIAMVALVGCSSSGAGTSTTTGGGSSGDASLAVRMDDISFEPQTLTVKVGDTVTWINDDSVSHNATAEDGSWKTDTFGKGGSDSVTFDAPGTYPYVCTLHAGMTGTIIVQ